jgi:hypothetical protein
MFMSMPDKKALQHHSSSQWQYYFRIYFKTHKIKGGIGGYVVSAPACYCSSMGSNTDISKK